MRIRRLFLIFIASLAAPILSSKVFWNLHMYAVNNHISHAALFGGRVWLYSGFAALMLMAAAVFISGAEFFRIFYLTCKYTIGGYIVRLMRKWADMA